MTPPRPFHRKPRGADQGPPPPQTPRDPRASVRATLPGPLAPGITRRSRRPTKGARRRWARNRAAGKGATAKPTRPVPPPLRSPFHQPCFVVSARVCFPRPALLLTPHSAGLTFRWPKDPGRAAYLPTGVFIVFTFYLQSGGARSSQLGIRTPALPLSSSAQLDP